MGMVDDELVTRPGCSFKTIILYPFRTIGITLYDGYGSRFFNSTAHYYWRINWTFLTLLHFLTTF